MKIKKAVIIMLIVVLLIILIDASLPFVLLNFSSSSVCSAITGDGHYYAIGYIDWILPRKWSGARVSFANPDPDYSVHNSTANQSLWVSTNGSNENWAEAGYSKGWYDNYGNINPNIRTLYQAYYYAPAQIYHVYKALTPPGNPGEVHTYTILYNKASNCWYLSIDGNYERPYPQLLTLYSKEIDIGLESGNYSNVCGRVYPYGMSFYLENEGWMSFGKAMPKTHVSNGYYHFEYTDYSKDSGVDYNGY